MKLDNFNQIEFVPYYINDKRKLLDQMENIWLLYYINGLVKIDINNFVINDIRAPKLISTGVIENEFKSSDDYYDDNLNFSKVDKIQYRISKNNPEIFSFLECSGINYLKSREVVKKIIRLSIIYS
ncbi:hypothetical protein [Clostridium ihumii]|uniref:hypothetical protein n=1 Tax=Clostridium ihumii TaxID=1470356 RepID=UPI000552D5DA|nr:hypothetical protein [Clostridium ihumii]